MQIVKGDRNSQLRKGDETHLRKINPQGSMAQKLKTTLSTVSPFDERSCGNIIAGRHHGCLDGVPCNTQSKEETGKKERPMTRCQGPAQGQSTITDDNVG